MPITDTANMETEIKSKHAIRSSKYTTNCKQHKNEGTKVLTNLYIS